MSTEGAQHVAFRAGFHNPAAGLHCTQRKIGHSVMRAMQLMLRKYTILLCQMPGFRSLTNRLATASFGRASAIIPGMKAILFHLMACDVAASPR